MKRIISLILCLSLLGTISTPLAAHAAEPDAYSLANENIEVFVSGDNGGFVIRTLEGNQLKKSDNNKKLLYHNGEYDTSFTSFEVKRGTDVREYIFGGSYGFLGLDSSDLTVNKEQESIVSEWTVDNIKFTQTIEVPNSASNQHGMISISYTAEVLSGEAAEIRTRILFDTALENQDFGYYNVTDSSGYTQIYENETAIDRTERFFPESIYASDSNGPSAIAAYSVNPTAYRVVFGHWNNLASTVFHYEPDPSMTFTNRQNVEYATADSAYALYNDMGRIDQGGTGSVTCYYGVYSNYNVDTSDSVAFNLVAPNALRLSRDKKSYLPEHGAVGEATFAVNINLENFSAVDFADVAIAASTAHGLTPLQMNGEPAAEPPSVARPYYVPLPDFRAGAVQNLTFQFRADVSDTAAYRRVELRAHDLSKGMQLTDANLIGSRSFYVLCPGGDGRLPKVAFTGADPEILYHKGGNRYIITGTNLNLLENPEVYGIKLESDDGKNIYTLDTVNDVEINPDDGTMTLLLPGTYVPGAYHVYFYWNQTAVDSGIIPADTPRRYTSEALRLVLSEDEVYRNNTYGIAAVVQMKGEEPNQRYRIMTFKDEGALNGYKTGHKAEYEEILLEFRGRFEVEQDDASGNILCLAGSASKGTSEVITINQCLDFQAGTIRIYYDGYDTGHIDLTGKNTINVDFDGILFTSGERTQIAAVPAAFTAIEDGREYDLLSYDMNGRRMTGGKSNAAYISLMWGNDGLQMLQSIGGSVFKLGFGIMGQFVNVDPATGEKKVIGKTVSFTGGFDLLGVLLPKSFNFEKGVRGGALDRIENAFSGCDPITKQPYRMSPTRLRDHADTVFGPDNDLSIAQQEINAMGKADVQILVQDVLFAHVPAQGADGKDFCGYYGFHVDTNIQLPQYSQSMPQIRAHVNINTIRNYNFAVDGSLKFGTLECGVELEVMSLENRTPVLNKIFIFFNVPNGPGLMVDPAGTLRITGGGGGLNNIYETVICPDKLPTIQVLLRLYLKIVEVLSGQADAMFSLQGISLELTNVRLSKLPKTVAPVVPYAGLKLQWLPNWYFHLALTVDLFGVVQGGGYIVVDQKEKDDVFFEAFLMAAVRIPDYVALVGGVEVGNANLGFNTDRVWGALQVLGISTGIVYYWGDSSSFDFGTGVGTAEPTYPELLPGLLGMEPVLLGYDEQAGKNLYMRVGTNLSVAAGAELVDDLEQAPVLMGSTGSVQSQQNRLKHKVVSSGAIDEIITLVFPAESYADAEALYGQMRIEGLPEELRLYRHWVEGEALDPAVNADANANLTWQEKTGMASLSIPCKAGTPVTCIITTPVPTDVTLLGVAPLPCVDTVSVSDSGGNRFAVNYTGQDMRSLDSISFYLSETNEVTGTSDAGIFLGTVTDPGSLESGRLSFPVPAGLPTGSYYVRAVYSQENTVNDYAMSDSRMNYVNSDQPAAPELGRCVNDGDQRLAVELIGGIPDNVSGYLVTVYDAAGNPTDFADIEIPKADIRNNRLVTGGSFLVPALQMDGNGVPVLDDHGKPVEDGEHLVSLTAGQQYIMGVRAFRDMTDEAAGSTCRLLSSETRGGAVTLNEPTKAVIQITSSKEGTLYSEGNVTFTVTSDEALTGSWSIENGHLDGHAGWHGTLSGETSLTLPFRDLPDNSYVLELWGSDATGDSFREEFPFTVDTTAPRLMISSPIQGSTFEEDGKLTITGISDLTAMLTVQVDGVPAEGLSSVPLSQLDTRLDENGCFSFDVMLDPGISSHEVQITAKDAAGNSSMHTARVKNRGLSNIDRLEVHWNGAFCPGQNINTKGADASGQLTLVAVTGGQGGRQFVIRDDMVHWTADAVSGTASVEDSGSARFGRDSEGYVVALFNVTDVAPMTAAATFGTLANAATNLVSAGSSVGGSIVGAGSYNPGQTVRMTAVPDSGYEFSHWVIEGVRIPDLNQAVISFVMPDGPVAATAYFRSIHAGGSASQSRDVLATVTAKAGEKKTVTLDTSVTDPNTVSVQYSTDGGKTCHTAAITEVSGRTVTFLAPVNGTYQIIRVEPVTFTDTVGHWARKDIDFVAARGIVRGVGDRTFAPDGYLTRAMFVTMLGRMQNELGTYAPSGFHDIRKDSWYSDYVAWAADRGIVKGYTPTRFAPEDNITREQVCVMLDRYLDRIGFSEGKGQKAAFADGDAISSWAADAVSRMQALGIVQGNGQHEFNPQGFATRAETAAVFARVIRTLLK